MGGLEYLGATDSIREMKLCSSLLLSVATAQFDSYAGDTATDRWGSYDYAGGFTYPTGSKTDGGASTTDDFNQIKHENGLYCWMCDERLDLGAEAETGTDHAYTRCLLNGSMEKCKGEQRTCMFEERRRNGVIYSVCTGCKQTDACLALWRRNQRFTLPFMNFGDMSIEHHADGKPIYIDDECTTYENTFDSAGTHTNALNSVANGGNGHAFSYAKFSYDTTGETQANGQMSQWESSCRWCCAATTTGACNLAYHATNAYVSPFNSQGCTTLNLINDLDDLGKSGANPVVRGAACELSNSVFGDGSRRFFQPFMLADPRGLDRDHSNDDAVRYIDDFVKTAMADLSTTLKNPVTSEGRNSLGMDKYKFRGNQFVAANVGGLGDHVFEHQSDMPSQENRDFFDQRADNSGK